MNIPTNTDRADRAREILRDYCRKVYQLEDGEEPASVIGDILADFRHLCAEEGIDFEAPLLMSEVHFNEETEDNEAELDGSSEECPHCGHEYHSAYSCKGTEADGAGCDCAGVDA